jgi:P4 family phage/plasmid primase-like protien
MTTPAPPALSTQTLIDKCIVTAGAHFDMARVVHSMTSDFLYDTFNQDWYVYKAEENRWIAYTGDHCISLYISTEVHNTVLARADAWVNMACARGVDESDQKHLREKANALRDIAQKLLDNTYKKKLVSECRLFFNRGFDKPVTEYMDTRENLLGFKNGVFDFTTKAFRPGHPDDLISFTTGYDYKPFSECKESDEINEFLDKVFTKSEIRSYWLDVMAATINGSIHFEKMWMMKGSGANGKSKCSELLQKALGKYFGIVPISLLTQKRAASCAASPEVAVLRGLRMAVAQEPGPGEMINSGLMKEMTGGDMIQARGLFKSPINFKPQYKMFVVCNDLPDVAATDDGTWRRISVLDHTSKFKDTPDPKKSNEFEMDISLSAKLEKWAPTFMSMLIKRSIETDFNNMYVPMDVVEATGKYKKDSDGIGAYISDSLKKDSTAKEALKIQTIYADFKMWCFKFLPKNRKVVDMASLKTKLEEKFGLYPRNGWKGLRHLSIGSGEEEDEDEEAVNAQMAYMKAHIVAQAGDITSDELATFIQTHCPLLEKSYVQRYILEDLGGKEDTGKLVRDGKRSKRGFRGVVFV